MIRWMVASTWVSSHWLSTGPAEPHGAGIPVRMVPSGRCGGPPEEPGSRRWVLPGTCPRSTATKESCCACWPWCGRVAAACQSPHGGPTTAAALRGDDEDHDVSLASARRGVQMPCMEWIEARTPERDALAPTNRAIGRYSREALKAGLVIHRRRSILMAKTYLKFRKTQIVDASVAP